MMYYFWMLHYSLVKRIYRKRIKGLKKGASNLAFLCVSLLLLSLLLLLTNKALVGKIIDSNVTLAPLGGAIAAIIIIPFLFLWRGFTSKKIGILRRVIYRTRDIKHIHAVLYVSFFVGLYILTFVTLILTIPSHK